MESPQMYDAAAAPPPPPQPDLKKTVEDKRQTFPPPDLDELNGQEISLDLQHLIEDQFRSEESMALFQEILPGGKSPQPRYNRTTLAYMPQPVHSGASYAPVQTNQGHEQAPPIKEEPPEPHDYRRSVTCAQYTGQYNPQSAVGVSGPYGGGFTPLPPLGAPLLPPLLKHKTAPPRRSSGKVLDKGTDEYRRRRERNNIAGERGVTKEAGGGVRGAEPAQADVRASDQPEPPGDHGAVPLHAAAGGATSAGSLTLTIIYRVKIGIPEARVILCIN
ncbi:hypothetical protein PYW07_009325 [Mythimna separata]|uniref:Uncharacterized protein n=1 Tax=Mythimna separata TaxID=271217 RepID=A0AAD7YBS4_MYTSE|nr:hypothetical protein PYW07_009325 [Mythimna separata]